jgi:GAF domain-containing protein
VRDTLDRLTRIRHLVLYFNTKADWETTLAVIRESLHADAVQVVCLEGLDSLSYHLLPADQIVDEDFDRLLHDGLTVDDHTPEGRVRLGLLMAINDDLLGVLMVIRNNGKSFNEYDRLLLANFADEMAIALYNIELYTLLREQADHLANIIRDDGYGRG